MQAIDSPPKVIQALTLDAPVTTVTLLEDRALVRRLGKANLTPGLWRVRVEQVAPVLSDKSLRAEFSGSYPEARITDVRIRRQMLIKEEEQPQEIQTLLAEWRSLRNSFKNLSEDRQHQEYSFQQVADILSMGLEEVPVDAIWGQIDPKSWREQFQTLFNQLRSLRGEILKNYQNQEQLSERLNDLSARIQLMSRPDLTYSAYIEADLAIAAPGECEIAFDYVVPNALWRPWHQARLLLDEKPSLSFRVDGCVWQRTGEDWHNVDLVFSTARASLGTEPPLLQDDFLTVREKSSQIKIQAREQKVQTTGGGSATVPGIVELPGVDDGGEVRNLRSTTKATILSDGRPYRVPLFSFESAAEVEYVLMPEFATQVVLKSEQTNRAPFPILAGPVDLLRSSEFVGKTSVLFIAPGEKFSLGWGADAAMRVQRTQTKKKEQDHLTKWNSVTVTTNLFLSNIGPEPRTIKTTERIPVSELEQVKVEAIADETTDRVQPDENGFCTWTFSLAPYSQLQANLVYKVSAAPEVRGL